MPDIKNKTTTTTKKRPPAARKQHIQANSPMAQSAEMKPPSVASVPDKSVVTQYVGRSFDLGSGKKMTDMEVFDYSFDQNFNMLIEGPTGSSKTMATRTWAASRNKLLARIPSNAGIDSSQLFGKFVPDKARGGFHWVDGPVTHVFRHGGVILWNEINFTPERVGSVMFGALDGQREIVLLDHESEVIRAHLGKGICWCNTSNCDDKRVLIVADQNPDYLGTRELNAALRNRFAMQLQWDYDKAVEMTLVKSRNLLAMAHQVRLSAQTNGFDTPISTNMLMEFVRLANGTSVVFASTVFVNHFKSDERESVRLVVEQWTDRIIADLQPTPPVKAAVPSATTATVDPWDDNTASDVAEWLFTDDS